ncbi:type II secretion system minor pseudopilin GspJ [Acinetobacter lwoffii]|uniref:Type II secretion system protein J n=1 Tax=Acinetobacter lwoffii NCTC 5866 = CIP 64.10 = NIPH 512 TaxID=981327 RepID=A0ABN0Q1G1_ACILW|nr:MULTISPECIES: type II secretion system minor pseudopilin GspJ [Acinetobacter]ENU17113.1 type II secretion system protein J [Acinetobacter sp. CIP A162]ESJ96547.1 type II secretion system protein J [Acinetobacter lwoffii NCTC 5866 = CIP 64.10 = NIPH 512]QXB39984.1 type II secretion system minor pseudopilin GspJ [Acinetobacter lwoffii]SUU36966.1 general secretion pathway protein J (PilD-dependent protein pddD) [Acinetobacter lwoffii]VFQ39477.1 general secretion pathway protein J (PilD-depende
MKPKGFTLVELLVAIAIFAVLSALGWKVFDYIVKTKDQNAVHEQRLGQLQETYQQILRDTVQAVPLTANINGDIQPALVLQNGRFNFSKTGVTDPLEEGISPDERIEYQYRADEQKLYRLKYRNLNQAGQDQPESSVLLSEVEQFQIIVLNPNELTQWPDASADLNQLEHKQRLPKGIKINLTVNGVSYEWMFSLLNTDFLLDTQNTGQPSSE